MNVMKKFIIVVISVVITIDLATAEIHNSRRGPEVFLTVAARVGKDGGKPVERRLRMHWSNVDTRSDNRVVYSIHLLNRPPNSALYLEDDSLYSEVVDRSPWGNVLTSVSFPRVLFNKTNVHNDCLGFWVVLLETKMELRSGRDRRVAAGKDKRVAAQSCLKANPNWMWDNRHHLRHLTLRQMMIPGTHNSGMYSFYNPRAIRVVADFKYTQEEDIFNQLAYGIRCLDLRVSATNKNKAVKYKITHDVVPGDVSIEDVLKQLKDFLAITSEFIILDLHRFPKGFETENDHHLFVDLLHQHLGSLMIPFNNGLDKTLEDLWQGPGRVVVAYNAQTRQIFPMLHLGVRHLWADTNLNSKLKRFFDDKLCEASSYGHYYFHSAMAELTPTVVTVIFEGTSGGLRKLADDTNPLIAQWFRDDYRECANIVATDYFLGTDIVNIAIHANLDRTPAHHKK